MPRLWCCIPPCSRSTAPSPSSISTVLSLNTHSTAPSPSSSSTVPSSCTHSTASSLYTGSTAPSTSSSSTPSPCTHSTASSLCTGSTAPTRCSSIAQCSAPQTWVVIPRNIESRNTRLHWESLYWEWHGNTDSPSSERHSRPHMRCFTILKHTVSFNAYQQ